MSDPHNFLAAVKSGDVIKAETLIRKNPAWVSVTNQQLGWNDEIDQNSPLHTAARYGHATIVEMMIREGFDVQAMNKNDDWTPLMVAAQYGQVGVIDVLLDHGADLFHCSRNGDTALSIAHEKKNADTAVYLRKKVAQTRSERKTQEKARLDEGQWTLTGHSEVTLVRDIETPEIRQRLTEVFNFENRMQTTIVFKKNGGQLSAFRRYFDEIPDVTELEKAHGQLVALGGKPNSMAIRNSMPARKLRSLDGVDKGM